MLSALSFILADFLGTKLFAHVYYSGNVKPLEIAIPDNKELNIWRLDLAFSF